jgi:hypothetical protein|tara:strand:- start:977 stop:1225 length:249 start_codon:yes stop_codon:yes gene_type:complete
MNFFLNRNKEKNRLKAREAQDIRDNLNPIVLSWECMYEETMPVLREEGFFELEQAMKVVLTEANLADIERKRKKWEMLYTSL